MPVNCYLVDTKYKHTNYIYSDKKLYESLNQDMSQLFHL